MATHKIKKSQKPKRKNVKKLQENRSTRVAPWRNKEEFDLVYEWLFGEKVNRETKVNASKRITIWKVRRLELTPATILGTLAIIDVQISDDQQSELKRTQQEIKMLYSAAFTRFLNYMSSIMQEKNLKTMYTTVKELGLESFLVDLRHLCAHGQDMPSLDVFRCTSDYCMKWLKECYWDHERNAMENINDTGLRKKDVTKSDDEIRRYFDIYDSVTEAIVKGCKTIADARKKLTRDRFGILKQFVNNFAKFKSFPNTYNTILKKISAAVDSGKYIKDILQIYVDAFLEMNFFFSGAADVEKDQNYISLLVRNYQEIFRQAAIFGVIEDIFYSMIDICENEYEDIARRKGATFWANKIITGFIALQQVKQHFKKLKEVDPDIDIDWSSLNSPTMVKSIKKLYKDVGVNPKETLIFGDTLQRPWTIIISRGYLLERISHHNNYTLDIIKNCTLLTDPPLHYTELQHINKIIDIYNGQLSNGPNEENNDTTLDSKVYTLAKDIIDTEKKDVIMTEVSSEEGKFGFWSVATDSENWHTCPLGRVPWEYVDNRNY